MSSSEGKTGLSTDQAPGDSAASAQATELHTSSADNRFRLLALILGVGHLAVATWGGLRWEHVAADAVLILLPWVGPRGLAFVRAALPLWITGVVVDNVRYVPLLATIHTDDIRRLEIALFPGPGGLSWPEWLDAHPTVGLDLACGFAYATYLLEFFLVSGYFYLRSEPRRFSALAWSFFAANVLGIVIYLLLPVAPPWYLMLHGPGPADPTAPGYAAGAARFDALLGIHYFSSFYARNPNVFGAMPSLHVSYPVLVVWYTWDRGWGWRVATLAFATLVAFAAVYLAHHYIIDVIAGAVLAVPCALWASRVAKFRPGDPAINSSSITGRSTHRSLPSR
jgi:membrane-associated phospholipid phosphatase